MHSHTNLHGAIVSIVEKKKNEMKREKKNGRLTKALSDMENYEDIPSYHSNETMHAFEVATRF